MIGPQSLDCPFLIAPSVFSNVYLARVTRRVSLDEQQLPKQISSLRDFCGIRVAQSLFSI